MLNFFASCILGFLQYSLCHLGLDGVFLRTRCVSVLVLFPSHNLFLLLGIEKILASNFYEVLQLDFRSYGIHNPDLID